MSLIPRFVRHLFHEVTTDVVFGDHDDEVHLRCEKCGITEVWFGNCTVWQRESDGQSAGTIRSKGLYAIWNAARRRNRKP